MSNVIREITLRTDEKYCERFKWMAGLMALSFLQSVRAQCRNLWTRNYILLGIISTSSSQKLIRTVEAIINEHTKDIEKLQYYTGPLNSLLAFSFDDFSKYSGHLLQTLPHLW